MGNIAKIIANKPETKKDSTVSRVREREGFKTANSPIDQILHLQRTIGNRAVQRLIKSGALQAKLKIGQPLSKSVRNYFEPRVGYDFSSVRIYANNNATQLNKDLSAQAFTHGKNLVFGKNQYSPGTRTGRKLLAHELTHFVQQNSGDNIRLGRTPSPLLRSGRGRSSTHIQRKLFKGCRPPKMKTMPLKMVQSAISYNKSKFPTSAAYIQSILGTPSTSVIGRFDATTINCIYTFQSVYGHTRQDGKLNEDDIRAMYYRSAPLKNKWEFNKLHEIVIDYHNLNKPSAVMAVYYKSKIGADAQIYGGKPGGYRVWLGDSALVNYYKYLRILNIALSNSEAVDYNRGTAPFPMFYRKKKIILVAGPKRPTRAKNWLHWFGMDRSEAQAHTKHKKRHARGDYRYAQVSSVQDFRDDLHNRAVAKDGSECVSHLAVDGHGNSIIGFRELKAWQVVGSDSEGPSTWGIRSIGMKGRQPIGLDMFKNIRFCKPCQITLGGCYFAKHAHGKRYLELLAQRYACKASAYDVGTISGSESSKAPFAPKIAGTKLTTKGSAIVLKIGNKKYKFSY